MKKKLLILSLALILIAVAATSTLAYFTSEDTAHNIITSNGIDIDILEWQDEACTIPYPDEPIEIMPGSIVNKVVTILNKEAESWIMADYTITVTDKNGENMQLSDKELNNIVKITISKEWTEKDGKYYYNSAVKTGEMTAPLFTKVEFSGPNMDNRYQNCTFAIDVSAKAVQTANNGASALEAAGFGE